MLILWMIAALLAVATFLPLSRQKGWVVRIFDFPRLQIFSIALIHLLASTGWYMYTRNSAIAWALLLEVAILLRQAFWIWPYTGLHSVEVPSAERRPKKEIALDEEIILGVMTVNVLKPNRQKQRLRRIIDSVRPHIVVAVETDEAWQETLDELKEDYPYSVKLPQSNLYGMHLYSQIPLVNTRIEYAVENDIPSIHTKLILDDGQRISLHCVHPRPPYPTEADTSEPRDAEMTMLARNIRADIGPTIVAGDLNDVAWSRTTKAFLRDSGLKDPRVGRGFYNSFHARIPFLRWPLDHLFCSREFAVRKLRRLNNFGSDHFPFFVELALPRKIKHP